MRGRGGFLGWLGVPGLAGSRRGMTLRRAAVTILVATLVLPLAASPAPHTLLADRLIQAVRCLEAFRTEFDVLFVYLPDRWEAAFFGHDDDFDLHDYLNTVDTPLAFLPTEVTRPPKAVLDQLMEALK